MFITSYRRWRHSPANILLTADNHRSSEWAQGWYLDTNDCLECTDDGVLRIVGRFYSPVLPMLGDNIRNGPTRSTLHSTGLVITSSSHIAVRPKEIHNIITHTHTHFSESMMFPFPLGSSFRFVRTLSPRARPHGWPWDKKDHVQKHVWLDNPCTSLPRRVQCIETSRCALDIRGFSWSI